MVDALEGKGYLFTPTQDWVSHITPTWKLLFPLVPQHPRVLEIGSWEGRSAVVFLEELCKEDGEIVCIDHFDLLTTTAGRERYKKLTHNLELTKKRFRVMDEFSIPALAKLLAQEVMSARPGYDWIYIDGSHEASDTFLDGELAWSVHHPRRGVDAFLLLHQGEFDLLSAPSDYQMILKKTSEMRIGFLLKPESFTPEETVTYGMNLAVAADSKFAMAAAVAIRSAVETTCTMEDSYRMSIYVLDCGLSDDDRRMIRETIPAQGDVTLIFINLPDNGLTKKLGAVWAKVDMIQALPVERVLYLDADVLVVRSLKDLWRTDLEGKPLGAVRDVGYPNGHEIKGPYFNAGVMLLDLALARKRFSELEALAMQENLRFLDQDALNLHFRGEWIAIRQEYNAQGLGTYADLHSVDREELAAHFDAMKAQPRIVHFTGPLHPSMAEVLNPFVKYSAKPWGYASAPNHPFSPAWWSVLERTAWKGVRTSEGYIQLCKAKYEEAVETAKDEFKKVLEKTGMSMEV
ncbi:glycosyltransferase family 8 protein [Mycena galericulata]|nr:glycosyltransferase family 8 protein [Mycena galericulata]